MADKRIPVGHGDEGGAILAGPINGNALHRLLSELMPTRVWEVTETVPPRHKGATEIKVTWKRADNTELIE